MEQHRHNTVEVSVYNMVSMLYEIETGEVYRMSREHDIFSGLGESEAGSSVRENKALQDDDLAITDVSKEELVAHTYENIKVHHVE